MVEDEPGGGAAWAWVQDKILTDSTLHSNPKWALMPQASSPTPPPPPSSACDLNMDTRVDEPDVNIGINQVLGTSPCTNGDLDNNGRCDAIDLQRVINAVLGSGCTSGP